MAKIIICYLFLVICILVILLQGLHPTWNGHLITDLFIFKERSIGNFTNNEYQPGALLFFSILSPFAIQTLETFKIAFLSINVFLIFLIAFFIQRTSKPENNIVLGLIILFTGPILLFRFELLVIFFVISSFYFFKREIPNVSSVLLALATTVKVYPIIYLPYMIINLYKQKGIKEVINFLLLFTITFTIIIFGFTYFNNFNTTQLIESVRYHMLKPVGAEGFWASIISIVNIILNGSLPPLISEYVGWGISRQYQILPMWFFDNFWIFILVLLYFFHLNMERSKKFNVIFLIIISLVAILFSKLSSPQFLIWFIFLLPLIDFEKFIHKTRYSLILLMALITAFFTQYIYPLNYSEFLSLFSKGIPSYIFYIFILKNIFLIFIFYLLLTLKDE